MFDSTMQDFPLTVAALLRHGRSIHGASEVVSSDGACRRSASFAAVAERVDRLAAALAALGVAPGDRVATLCWNTQEHLEAYLAVPMMGAVLHTANPRLYPEQLAYTIEKAGDRVIVVDRALAGQLVPVLSRVTCVEHIVLVGEGDDAGLPRPLRYDDLLARAAPASFAEPDERAAAVICFTSGTTGDPKGVVYSHRSIFLHTLAMIGGGALSLSERDRALPVVPMFHANAWGLCHAAWLVGADLVLPGRHVQAEPLCRLIAAERPTVAAGVPTVWNDVMALGERRPIEVDSLRLILCGGAAPPRALLEGFEARHGVPILQAWGLTETGPLAALAHAPRHLGADSERDWRARTGRVLPGVELRLVADDGAVLPWDGTAVGEIQVRGPWCTAAYLGDPTPDKFDHGWLRTGDIAVVHPGGFLHITDRAKDVIKSGGEWISSVELEGALMAHPDVAEASVIGVPDARWQERPLACVVRRPGSNVSAEELRAFLAARVARWWLPERWSFVAEIPRTSVGKFDKKALRARQADGELVIVEVEG